MSIPAAIGGPMPAVLPSRTAKAAGLELPTLVALLAFWIFCNPYSGIGNGSLIYSGRALADLDQAGVGRDIMFANDGQSAFTVFTFALRELAAFFGAADATMLMSAAATIVSFLGFVVLARCSASRPVANLAIVFAAALPAAYGGFQLFSYAETAATPRPFAEALVLCGLTALLLRRRALAGVLMVGAFLLHPIMALPGIVVLLAWLTLDDRRWILLILALLVAVLGAAWLGVSPYDRLLTIVDPEWRALLLARNPHLFPTSWPSGWIGRVAARVATLLIGAGLARAPLRRLFLLALVVGLFGLAFSFLLNERFTSLLLVQAQTWRMLWLTFAIANMAAAICAFDLWRRDGLARIVAGLVALSWIWADQDRLAVILAVTAVGCHYALEPGRYVVSRLVLRLALSALAVVGIIGLAVTQISIHDVVASAPSDLQQEVRRTVALLDEYTPLAILAAVLMIRGWPRLGRASAGVLSVCVLVVAMLHWDQRSIANTFLDSGAGAPDLRRTIATRPGEVYWINGSREAWLWLGRPQWLATIQGAGIVFSRDLAIRYKQRSNLAIRLGLADDDVLTPLLEPHAAHMPVLTAANVAAFCAASDAPAWIVAPLVADTTLAPGVPGFVWQAPVEMLEPLEHGTRYDWLRVSRYAVVACADAGARG